MKGWIGISSAVIFTMNITSALAVGISNTQPSEVTTDTQKPDISLNDSPQTEADTSGGTFFSDAVKALEAPEKGEFAKALEEMQNAGNTDGQTKIDCSGYGINGGGTSLNPLSSSLCDPNKPAVPPNPEKEALLKEIGEMQPEEMMSLLVDLNLRLSKLEASRNTLTAPFKVIDKDGRVILSVSTSGQGNDYLVMGATGEPGIFLQRNTEYARLTARVSADNRAYLNADQSKGANAAAEHANYASGLGTSMHGGHGLFVRQIAGQSVNTLAEIADQPGKKVALRLYNEQGKVVVSAGMNPVAGGAGTVRAANANGENVAFMGTTLEGEHGAVGVAKDGKDVAAMMAEPRLVTVYNDTGAPIVSMGKSDKSDGGNLTTRDPAGDGVFSAGYNSAVGGGDACVYRAKRQNTFCLGIGLPGMMGTMGN